MGSAGKISWPDVAIIENITITPLLGPSSKRTLVIAASPPSTELRHFRAGKLDSALMIGKLPQSELSATYTVEETTIFGGLLFRHFGHALAESIHRLWPRLAFKELRRAKVAFIPVHNAKVMPYVTQALHLHGIPRGDVLRIEQPVCFKRLVVGAQARQMAGPTVVRDYRTMLDDNLTRRLPPPGGNRRLYISRSRHHHTGSFYGEKFVEDVLAAENFEIVFPEQHSLTELVKMLRSSSVAVFAEGSAIHSLELCGSHTPWAFVIARRKGSVRRFGPLLSNVCEKWMISDHVVSSAGISENPKKNSGILDLANVFQDLWSFLGLERRSPVLREAVEATRREMEKQIHRVV